MRRFGEAIPILVFGSHCEDTTVRFSVDSLVEGVWFPGEDCRLSDLALFGLSPAGGDMIC